MIYSTVGQRRLNLGSNPTFLVDNGFNTDLILKGEHVQRPSDLIINRTTRIKHITSLYP